MHFKSQKKFSTNIQQKQSSKQMSQSQPKHNCSYNSY